MRDDAPTAQNDTGVKMGKTNYAEEGLYLVAFVLTLNGVATLFGFSDGQGVHPVFWFALGAVAVFAGRRYKKR